jgi:hypothetical protein
MIRLYGLMLESYDFIREAIGMSEKARSIESFVTSEEC